MGDWASNVKVPVYMCQTCRQAMAVVTGISQRAQCWVCATKEHDEWKSKWPARDTSTPENRAYWDRIDASAESFDKWAPRWLQDQSKVERRLPVMGPRTPLEHAIWNHFCEVWVTIGLAAHHDDPCYPPHLQDEAQELVLKTMKDKSLWISRSGPSWTIVALRTTAGYCKSYIFYNGTEIHYDSKGNPCMVNGKVIK